MREGRRGRCLSELPLLLLSFSEKTAVTLRLWLIVTEQVPVPEQAPIQPVNTALDAGVAVRVTVASLS